MSARAAIVLAVMLGANGGALAASQDNPLSRAVPHKEGASACFSRSYDAAHLKAHPRQMTQGVMLSLRYEQGQHTVRIMLKEKNRRAPLYIVGGCGWSDKANLGVDDKPLIKEFKATSGLDCDAFSGLNSDEEGGDYPIDFAADGKSLTLYLVDQTSAWFGPSQKKKTIRMRLGSEDLIFRLDRVDAATCRSMETALSAR
ncbi:MAG: hypothetical protein ACXWJ8_10705 [Xanthobacteraceae bacterium]